MKLHSLRSRLPDLRFVSFNSVHVSTYSSPMQTNSPKVNATNRAKIGREKALILVSGFFLGEEAPWVMGKKDYI